MIVSFQIMPRAQNAHAYVNAGFLVEVDSKNAVLKATVVFGGITPEVKSFKYSTV